MKRDPAEKSVVEKSVGAEKKAAVGKKAGKSTPSEATPDKPVPEKPTPRKSAAGKATTRKSPSRKPVPAPPPVPPVERVAALRRARRALLAAFGPLAPTEAGVAALRSRVRDHLEDVTVEWLDEVTAIYPELCLDAEAMHRRHPRVLVTCQFGVPLPIPAEGALEGLGDDDPECPSEEIAELLAAYRPQAEMVLLMVRAGRRGPEYGLFRLPRLRPR